MWCICCTEDKKGGVDRSSTVIAKEPEGKANYLEIEKRFEKKTHPLERLSSLLCIFATLALYVQFFLRVHNVVYCTLAIAQSAHSDRPQRSVSPASAWFVIYLNAREWNRAWFFGQNHPPPPARKFAFDFARNRRGENYPLVYARAFWSRIWFARRRFNPACNSIGPREQPKTTTNGNRSNILRLTQLCGIREFWCAH